MDDDRTKAEIQDELRERGLKVSGTKDELIERLENADEPAPDDESSAAPLLPLRAARLAAAQLAQLRGATIDGIAGIEVLDGETRVLVEVLELQRTPRSSDLLGVYEVVLDGDGNLRSAERLRRYLRGQIGEEGL